MNVECPKCNTEQGINEPTEPTPYGKVDVLCSNCGKMFTVDNPLGDDAYTVAKDVFPPGERFVPKGGRITKDKAIELGLIDEDGNEIDDTETDTDEEE